jgi:hypothetical protein
MKRWYPKAYCIIAQQEEMRNEIINELAIQEDKVLVRYNTIDEETIEHKLNGVDNPYPNNGNIKYTCINSLVHIKPKM